MSRSIKDSQGNWIVTASGDIGSIIAPKEVSPSTAVYEEGKHLIYQGVLYDVIDDIAIGDSLVVGTNIEESEYLADSVGAGSNFVGTTAEWNALSDAQKAQYDTYDLTDDFRGTGIDDTVIAGSSNVVTSGGVANHLVVGERKFYFDYQDGQYGYNTSANRGADTFFPFKGTPEVLYKDYSFSGTGYNYSVSSTVTFDVADATIVGYGLSAINGNPGNGTNSYSFNTSLSISGNTVTVYTRCGDDYIYHAGTVRFFYVV